MDDTLDDTEIDEEAIFINLLQSMGVSTWDSNVPAALADYARRCTAELLCDAKDYADHADRSEILAEDILFASKMSDDGLNQIEHKIRNLPIIAKEINKKNLVDFLPSDRDKKIHRYTGDLLVRSYTSVPGSSIYSSKNIDDNHDMDMEEDGNGNRNRNRIAAHRASIGVRQPIQKLDGDKFSKMKISSNERNRLKASTSVFSSSSEKNYEDDEMS